jgi:hypothetical protein
MTYKKPINYGRMGFLAGGTFFALVLIAAFCFLPHGPDFGGTTMAVASGPEYGLAKIAQATGKASEQPSNSTTEQRIEQMEKTLQSIKTTGEKAEDRSYSNKMMSAELIGYVRLVVVVLIVIAVAFPLTIWLLSRKRILGLSGMSSELATTLLIIEERQAKLAVILKEIQGEIDYLHTMSVPDLKNLIQQAENYLKQNETDLENAGRRRSVGEGSQK